MEQVKIKLPTNLKDMSLGKYQEYYKILLKYNSKDSFDEDDFWMEVITLFTGITEDDDMSFASFCELKSKLQFIVQEKLSIDLRYVIEINGVKYGLKRDLHNILMKEFNDAKKFYLKQEDQFLNMHYICAILYRPIIQMIDEENNDYILDEHNSDNLERNAKFIQENLSVNDMYGASVFFWTYSKNLGKTFGNSLVKMIKNQLKQAKIPTQELQNSLNSKKGKELLKKLKEKSKNQEAGFQSSQN